MAKRRTLPSSASDPGPASAPVAAEVAADAEPLLAWDFENVFSDKGVSFSAGASVHPKELSGLAGQTGGGPAEVFGEIGTVFLTRYLGTHDMFLWVTTARPLRLDAIRFRHWHNHNPRFPTHRDYLIQMRIDSGGGYHPVGQILTVSNANSGQTDTLNLGVALPPGKHRLGWFPMRLKFGTDTNTEFFAIKDLQLLGKLLDATPACDAKPPACATPDELTKGEPPPTGDLGFVTAVIEDNSLVRYDVRGLFTGEPEHYGEYDWEYNSWRLTGPGSRVTFRFNRLADATDLAVGVVWAGWGEETRMRVLVNDRVLAEDHAVHGSAWGNPMRETFPIPPDLLRKSNTVTLELREDSPMVLFFQSISLKRA